MKKVCDRANTAFWLLGLASCSESALNVKVESLPTTGYHGAPMVSAGLNTPVTLSVTRYSYFEISQSGSHSP